MPPDRAAMHNITGGKHQVANLLAFNSVQASSVPSGCAESSLKTPPEFALRSKMGGGELVCSDEFSDGGLLLESPYGRLTDGPDTISESRPRLAALPFR